VIGTGGSHETVGRTVEGWGVSTSIDVVGAEARRAFSRSSSAEIRRRFVFEAGGPRRDPGRDEGGGSSFGRAMAVQ